MVPPGEAEGRVDLRRQHGDAVERELVVGWNNWEDYWIRLHHDDRHRL